MALHPEVLAELEAESAARRQKSAEVPLQGRVNALEARLHCLEAGRSSNSNPFPDEFWADLAKEIREFVEKKCAPLVEKIKTLEDRPPLKYCGVWVAGRTYAENSLVTREGSLWIAKQTTAAFPGGDAEPDSWQLCCKRGRDGKDYSK